MKTKVKVQMSGSYSRSRWELGEEGFIDGYSIGPDGDIYALVIIGNRIAAIPIQMILVLTT